MLHHRATRLRASGADGLAPFGLGALGLTAAALVQQPLPLPQPSQPPAAHAAAVAAAYLAARAAADERAALARARAAQLARREQWRAPAAAAAGGRCFGDSLALPRCGGAAAADQPSALEAARGREWAAQMQAAYAALAASRAVQPPLAPRGAPLPLRGAPLPLRGAARGLAARARAPAPALASLRHVPTLFGLASGRRGGPLPSETMRFPAPRRGGEWGEWGAGDGDEDEVEALVRTRKYLRFGDMLGDVDSAAAWA